MFILAALFAAIDQLIRFNKYKTSWIPDWFFNWSLPIKTWNAEHFYQFAKVILVGITAYHLTLSLILVPAYVFVWYELRNLFMHLILQVDSHYLSLYNLFKFVVAVALAVLLFDFSLFI